MNATPIKLIPAPTPNSAPKQAEELVPPGIQEEAAELDEEQRQGQPGQGQGDEKQRPGSRVGLPVVRRAQPQVAEEIMAERVARLGRVAWLPPGIDQHGDQRQDDEHPAADGGVEEEILLDGLHWGYCTSTLANKCLSRIVT